MADREKVTQLGRLFGKVARDHHDATGGASGAEWYATRLQGDIDPLVGFSPTLEQITEWLRWADETHRAEAPSERWPFYYAELILDSVEDSGKPS